MKLRININFVPVFNTDVYSDIWIVIVGFGSDAMLQLRSREIFSDEKMWEKQCDDTAGYRKDQKHKKVSFNCPSE